MSVANAEYWWLHGTGRDGKPPGSQKHVWGNEGHRGTHMEHRGRQLPTVCRGVVCEVHAIKALPSCSPRFRTYGTHFERQQWQAAVGAVVGAEAQ